MEMRWRGESVGLYGQLVHDQWTRTLGHGDRTALLCSHTPGKREGHTERYTRKTTLRLANLIAHLQQFFERALTSAPESILARQTSTKHRVTSSNSIPSQSSRCARQALRTQTVFHLLLSKCGQSFIQHAHYPVPARVHLLIEIQDVAAKKLVLPLQEPDPLQQLQELQLLDSDYIGCCSAGFNSYRCLLSTLSTLGFFLAP